MAKRITPALTLRALDCVNAVLVHQLNNPHDGVVLRLAFVLEQAWDVGDAWLVEDICDSIEALQLLPLQPSAQLETGRP